MGASCALTALLVLTVITVARGQPQYYDFFQGLQQLLQPYQGNDNINLYNGATRAPPRKQTNRQESKRKTVENRQQTDEVRTKKLPPTNQYDYVFATTEKPSQKTTKSNSSQNNNSRSFNNKNEYSNILLGEYYNPYEITTKVNKINRPKTTTTTTEANYFNNNGNRGTTQNVFGNNFNANRPITENVFENANRRETFAVNNQPRPVNLISNGASLDNSNHFPGNTNNRPQNDRNRGNINANNNNRGTQNTDYNINFPSSPENIRNNNGFINTDNNNPGFNNFNNNGVSLNNRGTSNNNRGNSNFNTNGNRGNTNNFGGFIYPDTPQIIRPGVQPSPVDVGLPPITNRPTSNNNNFGGFNRPSDSSSVTFTDQPDQEPEILIGPDEDDMTEWQKQTYVQKAERMCEYYKSLTVKKVVALPLIPSPDPVEIKVSDCVPVKVPLVIGGSVTSIREFPHMALVGWRKATDSGYSWKCGGSLISDRYVLTAGHCTYLDRDANVVSGPPQAVQLGSSFLDDRGALIMRISSVIRHPKYKMRRAYHDIALIKMVSKVKFSEVIRPACLGVPPPTGRSVIATGWGRTEFGGDNSVQLRSVSLNVWDMQECNEIWGTSLKLPNGVTSDSHMCAGDRRGGHDTCQGDSGGPAQIQDGCLWRVVAVTSFGRSCAAPDTPALYAVIPHAFIAAQVFDERS